LLPNVYRIFQAIVRVFHRGWKHKILFINKINKERQRLMNAAPTRPSNKNQWQGAQADPKQKQDRAQSRARTD
jgi:hypothetical protein